MLETMLSLDDLVSPMIVSGTLNVLYLVGVFGNLRCSSFVDYVVRMTLSVQTLLQIAVAYLSRDLTLME